MITSKLRNGYAIIYLIGGGIFTIIFYIYIKQIIELLNYNLINELFGILFPIGSILVIAIYMIVYCIISVLYDQIILHEKGITIMNPETILDINWSNIADVVDYGPVFLDRRREIILKNKVQLYNRGIWKIILFWYKTNTISISQYKNEIFDELEKRLKK